MTKLPPSIAENWPRWSEDVLRQVWDGLDTSQRRQLAKRHPGLCSVPKVPPANPRRPFSFHPVGELDQADFVDDCDGHETEPEDEDDDDPLGMVANMRQMFGSLAQATDKPPPDALASVVAERLRVMPLSPETMANLHLEPPFRAHYMRDRERCVGDVLAVYWALVQRGEIEWDGEITTQGEWK